MHSRRNRARRSRVIGLAVVGAAALAAIYWPKSHTPQAPPNPAPGPVLPSTTDPEVLAALQDHPVVLLSNAAAESGSIRVRRNRLYYIRGGTLSTIRSRTRNMVSDLIREAGGIGGLNGTFFSDARVAGRGNKMIGPLLTGFDGQFAPVDPVDAPRCAGRPLWISDGNRLAIVPFDTWMGESVEGIKRILPNATDAFLAGGWLVHNSVPRTREQIDADCVSDANDPRRRAFVGFDHQNRIVLGATDYSIDSTRLARSLVKLGIVEAVLLDSGFSTSLVWKNRILVSGHSRRTEPSRPVPHALIVLDQPNGVNPS